MPQRNIFPHLVVGNTSKVSQKFLENMVIRHRGGQSAILKALVDDVSNNGTLTSLKSIASKFIGDGEVIISKAQLLDKIPDLDIYNEQLDSFEGTGKAPTLTIDTSDLALQERIWDSIFIHYIDNKDEALLFDLIRAIKIVALSGLDLTKLETYNWWKKSQILLPNPPFPLPKPEAETISGAVPAQANESELNAEIGQLSAAREDIFNQYRAQIQRLKSVKIPFKTFDREFKGKSDEDFDSSAKNVIARASSKEEYAAYVAARNGDTLSAASMAKLSRETQNTLKVNGLLEKEIDVPFIMKRLEEKIARASSKLKPESPQKSIVAIGGSLLSIDDAVYGKIICEEGNNLSHCELLHKLASETPDREYVQVAGMGYANVIRQKIVRHEADEIAHIESILKGETKEKTHRNLKVQEDFAYSETEKNQETETDTKSTNRFELSKEINKIVSQDEQFEAGVGITAGFGPVSISANVGYATGSSSSEANTSSLKIAKEVTERAINRIQERSLEIRETRSINETEVTNLHKINNDAGADHINGFFYWVDKVYENQVYNIGKRLMLEFMIPEPGAYHIFSSANSRVQGVSIEKPIAPRDYTGNELSGPLRSFQDVTRDNYHIWVALYGAQDAESPPNEITTISGAYSLDLIPGAKSWNDLSFKDLKVPDGYEADFGRLSVGFSGGSGRYISGFMGNAPFGLVSTNVAPIVLSLNQETDFVPLSFRGRFTEYHMNVEVVCQLSQKGYDKWRIDTFNSIVNAYNQQKFEYESALAQLESGVSIEGQNPIQNRITEKTELKKWALELLTLQRFDGFDSMKKAINGAPEIDFEEALQEGKFVKFFEQGIEWHNMTYLFYPYFWAHKQRWSTLKQLTDTDTKFTNFLQAGFARLVVPVHPKFTKAILHYLQSGEVWNGQELPAMDDPLYLSIIQEIQEMEDNTSGETVGDPWETRVPTNLVMIDSTIPPNLPGS
jgi:hypothetical protein